MKMKIFAAFAAVGITFFTAGCVHTENDNYAPGIHYPDNVVSRYQRSVDEVYAAAIAVINNNGVLISEYIPHDTTNTVRAFEAKVDKEKIYVRVEAVDPQITQITIQARQGVVGDEDKARQLDKEIYSQLSHNSGS